MRLRSINTILIVGACLLSACGKRDTAGPETQPERIVESAATIPGTQAETMPDDPREGGWETESWNTEIGSQLKLLKLALLDGALGQALDAIEGDGCVTTLLVPEQTEVVDSRVSRLAMGERVPPADSLAGEFGSLRGLFAGSTPSHASAKIVAISAGGEGIADTQIKFQLDGSAAAPASHRLQVNSDWACRWRWDGTSWRLLSLELLAFEEVRFPSGAFADATAAVLGDDPAFREQFSHGQDHWMARIEMRMGIDVSAWQGLAISDIDGDGLEDLYVSQSGGLPNRLFQHRPDGTLADVSDRFGVDWLDTTHGSLFADLDNDGDPDLLVGTGDGIVVMENQGGSGFAVAATLLLPSGLAYSIAAADIDQDADLDFFVCGYTPRAGVSRHHVFAHPVPYHDANNGGRNTLFRNDGQWRFSDVTRATGIDEHNTRFSYAASWEDYDLDGDLDLYLANDFGRNGLYRNELAQSGRVRFSDVAEEAGVVDIAPGMSVCWGDYNNDGLADLYVGNMFSSAGNRIAVQPGFHAGADSETRGNFLRHASGNSLFENLGDGSFADVGKAMGVNMGRWAWSSKFADLDNDGWLDIVVANGFITQEDTGDL